MTQKRYNPDTGALEESLTVNGPATVSGDPIELSEMLYELVGAEFKMDWEPVAKGEPIVYTATLPSHISEAEVVASLNALRDEGHIRY